jgi:MFS family permease
MTSAAPPLHARLRRSFSSEERFDRRLLAPLISGAVLNPINSTIIAVALVPIGVAFGEPASATAWLISALYLATAVGQPVAGRLIDMYGTDKLFPAHTHVAAVGDLDGLWG